MARNFGGIEFRGVNFNSTAMEFYRDTKFGTAVKFYHGLKFCIAPLAALKQRNFIAIQNFAVA